MRLKIDAVIPWFTKAGRSRRILNRVSRNATGKLVFPLENIQDKYRNDRLFKDKHWDEGFLVTRDGSSVDVLITFPFHNRVARLSKKDAKLLAPLLPYYGNWTPVRIRWGDGRSHCYLEPFLLGLEP